MMNDFRQNYLSLIDNITGLRIFASSVLTVLQINDVVTRYLGTFHTATASRQQLWRTFHSHQY